MILCEYLISAYRKDTIYTNKETIVNILTFMLIKLVNRLDILFIALFFLSGKGYGPTTEITIMSLLSCLVMLDFFYYLFHRLKHSSFFWTLHKVHHNGEHFTMTTNLRVNILEHLLFAPLPLLPAILIGYSARTVFLAAGIAFLHQYICHSTYIRFPKFFDLIFITPSNHMTHHDSAHKNTHSNFANIFSVWDRMFGTYSPRLSTSKPTPIEGCLRSRTSIINQIKETQLLPIKEFFLNQK